MKPALPFVLLVVFSDAILIINKCEVDFDPEYTTSEVTLFNDGIHDTLVCLTTVQRQTWNRGKIYLKVSMPSDKDDRSYRKQILNTIIEMDKVVNGVASNVFVKSFLKTFFGVIDFKPGFPLKPGVYRIVNATLDEKYILLPPESKFSIDIRVVGRFEGQRKNVFVSHFVFFCEKRRSQE